ncbi:MAG: hypothetical protein GXO79_16655 [Chlorobi bacterium]|nr:hypothetical protein [Chlorobiota bacterium]
MKISILLKKLIVAIFAFVIIVNYGFSENLISAYYKLGTVQFDIPTSVQKVKSALENSNFKIIGEYKPGNNPNLYVVAFTRKDLQDIVLQKEDRGLMAGVMKVGFYKTGNGTEISFVNPMYLFNAYLMEDLKNYKPQLASINNEIRNTLKSVNSNLSAFGGQVDEEELWEYHYMFGMPYFTDPVELKEFTSFEQGVKIIKANLAKKTGNTIEVYEVIRNDKKVAVFGIGLLNPEDGEAHFLPIIGEKHVAAMPYEIILQNNAATMLNGRYRIALHWPELTMGTFTQIMSTPGDIEETFQKLVE